MVFGVLFYIYLNDIFEAESAVTGQAFAFASPTQILTMGPCGVNVAEFYTAGASSLLTTLKNQSEKHTQDKPVGTASNFEVLFLVHSKTY